MNIFSCYTLEINLYVNTYLDKPIYTTKHATTYKNSYIYIYIMHILYPKSTLQYILFTMHKSIAFIYIYLIYINIYILLYI